MPSPNAGVVQWQDSGGGGGGGGDGDSSIIRVFNFLNRHVMASLHLLCFIGKLSQD